MLLETYKLSKKYGSNLACNEICLSLTEGQVFGMLGPNGAGKSTLIKMLLGLVHPTSGQAYIKGRPVRDIRTKKLTGYLPELFRFYEWLTAYELLRFYARVQGISPRDEHKAIQAALELVGLRGREKEKIQDYSKGMQQRLGLAGAILHHPLLLFLDEPTSALDPIGRREVRDIIAVLKSQKTTILLNSHLLSEVEMTCTHLGFIKNGCLLASGKTEEFMQSNHEITIEAKNIDPLILNQWVKQGRFVEQKENTLIIGVDSQDEVPAIVAQLVAHGASIYKVDSRSTGLEEVFLTMIEGE